MLRAWNMILEFRMISAAGVGPPLEVDRFSWLDRSDQNRPFHLIILTHSKSQHLAVCYFPCTTWRKTLIIQFLWVVNSGSIGVTCISTCSYTYSSSRAASQAKCMFWLLTALKDDLFPERIGMFFLSFESSVWTHTANNLERSAQNNTVKADLHGTTLPHTTSLQQACDMS